MSGFSTDTIKVYLLDVPDAVNDSYTSTLNSIVEFDPLINDDYDSFYKLRFNGIDPGWEPSKNRMTVIVLYLLPGLPATSV